MIDTDGDVKLKTNVPKLTPYKEGGCLRELFCVKWKKPKRRLLLRANQGIYFLAFNNESLLQINLVCIKVVNNFMTYKCFTRLR